MPLVEDTRVAKVGDVTFLDESAELASDIVPLIPIHCGLYDAPEPATSCNVPDC